MSGGDRSKTNKNLRVLLNTYMHGCQPGTTIDVRKLSRQFSNNSRYITNRRISSLLRDREDLVHKGVNEWKVIGCL